MSDRLEAAVRELVAALRDEVRADAAPTGPERCYDLREASALLSIGRSRAYGEISAGRLASIKVGRRRLVPASALQAFVNQKAASDKAADTR